MASRIAPLMSTEDLAGECMDRALAIRTAHQSDSAALSELAMRTYAAAFGHSLRDADLAAHLRKNLSPEKFSRIMDEDVWEHNHGAQRFYRRYGFEVVGTRAFEVESGAATSLDLVMMRRSTAE